MEHSSVRGIKVPLRRMHVQELIVVRQHHCMSSLVPSSTQ